MLCQQCKKNIATTHVRRTIDGETTEYHLCADCARKQGITGMFGKMGFDFGDFWGSFFAEPVAHTLADTVRCEHCGSTFREIADSGKVGCAECYTTFYDRLLPSIQRIHGKVEHCGKLPQAADASARKEQEKEQELSRLKEELNRCIQEQKYEECASLRDRIRALEQAENGQQDGNGGEQA